MKKDKVLIRASKAGLLMVGGNELTEKQIDKLRALKARQESAKIGLAKPLPPGMAKELEKLENKHSEPFEFGKSAKDFIESIWLKNTYGYKDVLVTEQTLKGNYCEQDSIGLVSDLITSDQFRVKNKEHFVNAFFKGTPDVVLRDEDTVEDIKSSWNLKTFFQTREIPELYYAQGQVYMDLTGLNNFRLHYCFVDTPEEVLWQIKNKYFHKFGRDEDHPQFIEIAEQLDKNHHAAAIDKSLRLKTFEFGIDHKYLKKLKTRVLLARKYYQSLSLTMKNQAPKKDVSLVAEPS